MTESLESLQLQLRDAAIQLRTRRPRSYTKADLTKRLVEQFPDVGAPSSQELLEAIEQALGLVDLAEELAGLQRSATIDEATARQRLRDEFPGFSERSYRTAYAEGMFVTR